MIKRFLGFTLLLVAMILNSGCSKVVQSMADNVDYKLVKVDINVMQNSQNILGAIFSGNIASLAKVNITPHIRLTNNNNMDFEIYKTEYRVFVDNSQIADGVSNATLTLKAHETKDLALPIEIKMDRVATGSMDILVSQDMSRIKVLGKNYVRTGAGNFVVGFVIEDNRVKIESVDGVGGK
ncbi:LEA type 2 family protein [Sulfurovum sp. bin170]|uniref:NDR1/HIN1-like protein n=1 Tax=Sulfurovum sp. bin170 TaxID=2695268 RepID=UPI0013DE9B5F|nr:LEA type 2 family protein [Sulfurovum sp. bin170]NEW60300.1 LEA type 2 family protein [Sulfurovum sp. bin170]